MLLTALSVWGPPEMSADEVTVTSSAGFSIPGNYLPGVGQTVNVTADFTSICRVSVTLNISGGLNGGYYAYLVHTDPNGVTGFCVLLNRDRDLLVAVKLDATIPENKIAALL